ncbi:MAG: glycosyltransferase family 9 protein [Flavobacteriales bacterium]|nr:glycosyltransferase family 9 protein [Flavobacteriales bacterium]
MDTYSTIKYDCRHFQGHIPCKPNKLRGKVCGSCDEYVRTSKRILFIKLGAIGDVIRTTPLVTRFRSEYPDCRISWITHSPAILPKSAVDDIWRLDTEAILKAESLPWDIAINLDKDVEACALLARTNAKEKFGFTLRDGHIDAATPAAEHKLVTGLFDGLSKTNTKNYLEEIFEVCHLDFRGEDYLLDADPKLLAKWKHLRGEANGKPVIGLNTGCGERWRTRLWPEENWVALIEGLQQAGFYPMVLGGPDEHGLNTRYQERTGCAYPGHHSLQDFIAISAQCDAIVTQVSMMMHIAIGLKKPMVLFNNIFNRHEFELYGRGVIVEPTTGCDCYYGNTCTRSRGCMHDIAVEPVLAHITKLAGK